MNRSLTIAVHGATGAQGGAVAAHLTAAGHDVRPLSRAVADHTDADALQRAYAGADAVVASLPLLFSAEAHAVSAAIAAAVAAAAIPRVVVNPNGPLAPVEIGVPYVDARLRLIAALRDTVPHVSVVGPAAGYMDNLAAPWSAPQILRDGVVAYPVPADLPAPWVALADVAAEIGGALAADAPPAQLVVAGRPLTGAETAAELAAGLGRDVRWETIPAAAYRAKLEPFLGAETAAGVAAVYEAYEQGDRPAVPEIDPAVLRVGPTPLRAWARTALAVPTAA